VARTPGKIIKDKKELDTTGIERGFERYKALLKQFQEKYPALISDDYALTQVNIFIYSQFCLKLFIVASLPRALCV
jgi:hypothetical protein